jgi:hypothetical protein
MSKRADRVSLNWDGFDCKGYRYMTLGTANVNGCRKVQVHVFEQNGEGHYCFDHKVYVPVPGNMVTIRKDKLISLVRQRIRELAEDNYAA